MQSAFRWLSGAVAFLLVVQAALAGRGFMLSKSGFMDAHEIVADVVFLAGLALFAVAFSGYRQRIFEQTDLGLSAAILVLIFAQMGLGYGGRDNATAASLHWPNGVLITVIAALLVGRAWPRRSRP